MSSQAAKDRRLYASIASLVWDTRPDITDFADDDHYKAFLERIDEAKQATTERQDDMILTAGEFSEREPAPEGPQRAKCTEIRDLGVVEDQYGPKHKVEFRWELDAKNAKGFPFVVTRKYNAVLSINPKTGRKSDLRRDLDTWRGKPFTDDEIKAGRADTDQFLNKFCILIIEHKPGNQGGIFAAVTAVMPPLGDAPAKESETPLAAALKASLKKPPVEAEPY